MDPRLLGYYNRELQFIREMGAEFAKEFPKIAGRLGIDEFECADPYVERLLEGFAFLAARVQLKLDAEFPQFCEHLLETVYPNYLAPTPSMAVVQFRPGQDVASLTDGFNIPRDTSLRGRLAKGEQTRCEYRTSQDVTLWPIELVEVAYLSKAVVLDRSHGSSQGRAAKASLRLKLRALGEVPFERLSMDSIRFYLPGKDETAARLYEQLVVNSVGLYVRGPENEGGGGVLLDGAQVQAVGFADEEALLPAGARTYGGYRLVQEYFAFPERFLFIELRGLGSEIRKMKSKELSIEILFDRADASLESRVGVDDLALFCAPVINLFPKKADRIHVSGTEEEFHVVMDRSRPTDFEVFQVSSVMGYGVGGEVEREFRPLYHPFDSTSAESRGRAYYTVHREPRVVSKRRGSMVARSDYVGAEVFLSLADSASAPFSPNLKQLAVETLCTNRDAPLRMPVGLGTSDFDIESGAPVESIRCLAGPTAPRPSLIRGKGEVGWRLISHLSLNYLSLVDTDGNQGPSALKEMLQLYGDSNDPGVENQIEGLRSVSSQRVTRRLMGSGPISFGRGLEVNLTCDERAFQGTGVVLFGLILREFLTRYVSVNSFVETVLKTISRGEIHRWMAIPGQRPML